MSHLRAEQSLVGLWRWSCAACTMISLQAFITEGEALESARRHSYELHPEYHGAPPDVPSSA